LSRCRKKEQQKGLAPFPTDMPYTHFHAEPRALSGQVTYGGDPFPLVLVCVSARATLTDAADWIRTQRDELGRRAHEHGAILFRGFPLASAADFDAFVAAFGYRNFPYDRSLSNAVRINRTERVFTANEAPPDAKIYLHHEMAQTPIYPSKLFFFCEQPAGRGGATPLCRSDVLLDRLSDKARGFVQCCETKGLKYTNTMPPQADHGSGMGRSWQSTWSADRREEAESRMRSLGYSWQWLPDGSLRATTPRLPAVRPLDSGRKSFFNQLIAASHGWKDSRNHPSKSITFGDGSPLPTRDLRLAGALADEMACDIQWQRGDVALVDNFVTMHGRQTFEGTRQVLASLVAADD